MMEEYKLELDLSPHEHDVLINVLKRESYHPTVKKILYKIIDQEGGFDDGAE